MVSLNLLLNTKAHNTIRIAEADVLDVAFRADIRITDVLSVHLGRDIDEIVRLRDHIISRLPIPQRLKHLREIMEQKAWDDDFPFIIPVFTRLFEIRNTLAHSLTHHIEADEDNDDVSATRWSVQRGNLKSSIISLSTLRFITKSAAYELVELEYIWVRSVPRSYWFAK